MATSTPDFSGFDYSGPTASNSLPSDSIAPYVYDPSAGYTEGPIINSPGVGGYSTPASDPNSVGGILVGLGSVLGGISKIVNPVQAPGTVPRPSYRLNPYGSVGTVGGGSSLLLLALLGAGAFFLLKKKAA